MYRKEKYKVDQILIYFCWYDHISSVHVPEIKSWLFPFLLICLLQTKSSDSTWLPGNIQISNLNYMDFCIFSYKFAGWLDDNPSNILKSDIYHIALHDLFIQACTDCHWLTTCKHYSFICLWLTYPSMFTCTGSHLSEKVFFTNMSSILSSSSFESEWERIPRHCACCWSNSIYLYIFEYLSN